MVEDRHKRWRIGSSFVCDSVVSKVEFFESVLLRCQTLDRCEAVGLNIEPSELCELEGQEGVDG